jgi:hypothetical protein
MSFAFLAFVFVGEVGDSASYMQSRQLRLNGLVGLEQLLDELGEPCSNIFAP